MTDGTEATSSTWGTPSGDEPLWRSVDRLLAGASLEGILAHKLGPLAAARLRRLGEPLSKPLADEERAASLAMLTAVPLVQRIRERCDGPLLLLKGPELAHVYPRNGRRFGDIDVLTPSADDVQRSLLEGGFVLGEPDFDMSHGLHHHLPPIRWPSIWLNVEVHAGLNWPPRGRQPSLAEILEATVPSSMGIDGVSAPHPTHHALIVASHAWRHEPLQFVRDLLDVAAMRIALDERELDRLARAWGIERMWQATAGAIDGLFFSEPPSLPLRTWARHLGDVRARSIFENHLQRWLHAFWELPPGAALAQTATVLGKEITPAEGETWSEKRKRVWGAIRNPEARVEVNNSPALRPARMAAGDEAPESQQRATTP